MGACLTGIVLSVRVNPVIKFAAKVDYYVMSTSREGTAGNDIGTEIDFTGSYGYSKDLKIIAGVSIFTPGDVFKAWNGEDTSTWGYLMTVYNF